MVDHATHVKKYAPKADDAQIASIVRYCGIALQHHDSSLVSCSDPEELKRVREHFAKKKLGLTGDAEIDTALQKVCQTMKADHNKPRVTFYYLLAEQTGTLDKLA